MSHRKSDLGIPLPYIWLNPSTRPRAPANQSNKKRILACWIYGKLYTARNNYLHGNPVTDDDLVVKDSKRLLLPYAAVLYRMALTDFLDLCFREKAPPQADAKAFDDYEERKFGFQKYQMDMEAALATITISIEEQQRRSGGGSGQMSLASLGPAPASS